MKILILPGDGIGPEVVAVAASALETLNQRFALSLSLEKKEIMKAIKDVEDKILKIKLTLIYLFFDYKILMLVQILINSI